MKLDLKCRDLEQALKTKEADLKREHEYELSSA
jgi:hypothetical protein